MQLILNFVVSINNIAFTIRFKFDFSKTEQGEDSDTQ